MSSRLDQDIILNNYKFPFVDDKEVVSSYLKDSEYGLIINDILAHEEFFISSELKHHDSSILKHSIRVSYSSYKWSKSLGLDYHSAARAGLLHDFFQYDWRNQPKEFRGKLHGFHHPKVALKNSIKHFSLNDIEKDAVVKHMWPLTLSFPKYKESYVVTFADKMWAVRETTHMFKNFVKNVLFRLK